MGRIVFILLLILAANIIYAQPLAANKYVDLPPSHFEPIPNTLKNMSVLIIDTPSAGEFGIMTESGLCAGASAYKSQDKVGIAVWEDDPRTIEIDGAVEGEPLQILFADPGGSEKVLEYEILEGEDTFEADAFLVVKCLDYLSSNSKKTQKTTKSKPARSSTKATPDLGSTGQTGSNFKYFKPLPRTDKNMSVLLLDTPLSGEFAIFTESGLCPAVSACQNQDKVGLALWGDSEKTPKVDGAKNGEPFQIFFAGEDGIEYDLDYEIVQGKDVYEPDEFVVLRMLNSKFIKSPFVNLPYYPFPLNSTSSIDINLEKAGNIKLILFDLNGKKISELVSVQKTAGKHKFSPDFSNIVSGEYLLQFRMENRISKRRILLAK